MHSMIGAARTTLGSKLPNVTMSPGWMLLRAQNRGAVEPAGAEIGEGLVGLAERIGRGLGDDADLGARRRKSIPSCRVRLATDTS